MLHFQWQMLCFSVAEAIFVTVGQVFDHMARKSKHVLLPLKKVTFTTEILTFTQKCNICHGFSCMS